MKKFFCIAAIIIIGICSALSLGGCKVGKAYVDYALSEDGTYYIVKGVSGDKRGLTEYEVPETYCAEEGGEELPVKEIGDEAFYECYNLNKVTLPDSIERIGVRAFAKCSFKQFTITENVTEICFGAFGMCESLTEITVPQSVTVLEPLAFAYCTGLKTAYVKAEVTDLKDMVFYNSVATVGNDVYTHTSLKAVYLSASITKICNTALAGNRIKDIYFAGSEEQWDALYFYENKTTGGATEEKPLEKDDVIKGVNIHFNAEF